MEHEHTGAHHAHHATHHAAHHATHHTLRSKKWSELSIPLAIVFAGALIALAILFTDNNGSSGAVRAPLLSKIQQKIDTGTEQIAVAELALRPDDHVRGNPDALVLVIEYSDSECPFCKKFHETMLEVMGPYEKAGNVAWVYRYFPLDQIHPKARKEAEAMECANELGGNDAFWKYVDKIFYVTPANNGLDPAELPLIAQEIGLDMTKFNACLSSGKYANRVQKDFESGANVGVRGTPFMVVWNKKTGKQTPLEGALPPSGMKNVINSAL